MRSSMFIAFAVSATLLAPTGVFAEEIITSSSAGAGGSTTAGTSGNSMGTMRPRVPGGPMQIKISTPRDAASGQASGKIMLNASGTPPHPGMRDRMMGSGTPEKMDERMDAAKERMNERRDEMRNRMMEKKSDFLKRMAKQSIERLRAAAERLSKLADRLESRIAKIKEKGGDTTKTTVLLATARTQINTAKTALNTAESSVAAAIAQADISASSTTKIDAGKTVREALKTAQEALKTAHKALVDAIVALKASAPKELNTNPSKVATTSASSTTAQ